MTISKARARRIGDRILEELAVILQKEAEDPRLSMVTVTGVDVDRELSYATVFISALGDQDRQDEVIAGLERARGFLRTELASRIPLRKFPQLRFRWDASYQRGARIEELLDQLKSEEKEDPELDTDAK
jgi:ribosome-binding factor A